MKNKLKLPFAIAGIEVDIGEEFEMYGGKYRIIEANENRAYKSGEAVKCKLVSGELSQQMKDFLFSSGFYCGPNEDSSINLPAHWIAVWINMQREKEIY